MSIKTGIEEINIYSGSAVLDVFELARARNLDNDRFKNLLMEEKTVPMPYEDPVSNAINAAKPIIDNMSQADRDKIDMLITCTESGIDFGKSISTYVHHYLELNRNCRLFEMKNACYSGTAGLQMAINFILSGVSPDAKVLVVATDISRMTMVEGGLDGSFAEPSGGSGAVAMLVSNNPKVLQIDVGANGYYGYEVFDTCRPVPDSEAGDADLSLLSYLDCCENAFKEYQKRVEGVDYQSTFQYLAFHTPFGGMVKGAHRTMMRKFKKAKPDVIEQDFNQRVNPSLEYCKRVGNIMGATVPLALASTIDNADFTTSKRIGVFSYGSGCCSEFYSGVANKNSQQELAKYGFKNHLDSRYKLSMDEYESLFHVNEKMKFGTRNYQLDVNSLPPAYKKVEGTGKLIFSEINDYYRKYTWV
ncbi:hydroxymethylglutaryl-CoA synthase family protein [Aquimarina aggregata]|uniref:hydroxymethylglutaryl-CoA synthase family protein n=1 Tax=Aquimarina aggregata TaxID=1642818 RepID=UPI0024910CD9|nr:hydroxymethylglutaryl-CoA synthase family protein [Aquimarina aggregata]